MLLRYWHSLCSRFGFPATFAIIMMTFCNSIIRASATFVAQYYLKLDLSLPPAAAQAYMTMIILGWALKPLFGTVTDALPLFGLKYKPYVLLNGDSVFVLTWFCGWRRRARLWLRSRC